VTESFVEAGSLHDLTSEDACVMPPLIASKCFLQPVSELAKHEAEISAGRFFEKVDDTLAEVLPGFINRAG
jgi:hypothetical protein